MLNKCHEIPLVFQVGSILYYTEVLSKFSQDDWKDTISLFVRGNIQLSCLPKGNVMDSVSSNTHTMKLAHSYLFKKHTRRLKWKFQGPIPNQNFDLNWLRIPSSRVFGLGLACHEDYNQFGDLKLYMKCLELRPRIHKLILHVFRYSLNKFYVRDFHPNWISKVATNYSTMYYPS